MYGGDTRNLMPFTREDAAIWYEKVSSNPLEWVIEFNGKCVGTARLTVDEKNKRARYAVGIHDSSSLGMGLGTDATRLVLDFAFQTLGLHRVDLKVLEYNKRAMVCYEKCGFKKEGAEREGALIEGRWETDVIMSVLEQEYRNQPKIAPTGTLLL
jgi:[ribosomal protein S5]-alanine N-acetyltransferase